MVSEWHCEQPCDRATSWDASASKNLMNNFAVSHFRHCMYGPLSSQSRSQNWQTVPKSDYLLYSFISHLAQTTIGGFLFNVLIFDLALMLDWKDVLSFLLHIFIPVWIQKNLIAFLDSNAVGFLSPRFRSLFCVFLRFRLVFTRNGKKRSDLSQRWLAWKRH